MTADSNASANPPVDAEAEAIARRDSYKLRAGRLGALAIAFFVISAAAPLTGMAGGAPFAMLLAVLSIALVALAIVLLVLLVAAFMSPSAGWEQPASAPARKRVTTWATASAKWNRARTARSGCWKTRPARAC